MRELTAPRTTFVAGAILLALVVGLRWEGRTLGCACGQLRGFVPDANSSHTSQHFSDPYSLTHLEHGLILWGVLTLLWPQGTARQRGVAALAAEALWELFENSPVVIERYRTATAALGYTGDSILNSAGDLVACYGGFWLANRLGWRRTAGLWLAIEMVLLATIRDCLTLNVLMLVSPVEAIKQWQLGATG